MNLIICSSMESNCEHLTGLLASAGFSVYGTCRAGSEVRRLLNVCGDGVVLIGGSLSDEPVDRLAWDIHDKAKVLLVAQPQILDRCECPYVFHLKVPCPGGTIVGAVEILMQMSRQMMPRRTGKDREMIEEAKQAMMAARGISEPEAHRELQHYAMNHGMKLTEVAARMLRELKQTGE